MSEYLQDSTSRSERSLLRQVESDGLRSRRQPIRGRRQICDPMASCLVNTFLLLHTAPWCIQPVENEKKSSPKFSPTLLWQPTTQQLFPRTESSRKSHVWIVTQRSPWPTKGRVFQLPLLNCHLKFLHTFQQLHTALDSTCSLTSVKSTSCESEWDRRCG